LQLPADSLSVFDSNQESTVCYARNGFMNTKKQQKLDPGGIAVLGGGDSKSRIARSRIIFCASICRSGTRSQRRPITVTSSSKCWTVLRRSYFHFLAHERMPARNDAAEKVSIGKRAAHELKEFLIIAACFTALAYLKAAILEAQGIAFALFGFAVVKAIDLCQISEHRIRVSSRREVQETSSYLAYVAQVEAAPKA
jgi:hypothetical protein